MVLAVGYLIWETVNLWINRMLAKDMPATAVEDSGEGEGGGAGKSRMATVLPLIRMALQTTIITITVLLALSRLGVNITPLLAGAGVLGLAVGFGAQTLVKDIVSGVFFLLDDAFRVGEFIDIGGTVGSVAKISIRSLQLRHPNGPVHIIPYGEIPKLTNHSRDYVIMKLRFTVPFDTDLEKVRKLFKKIGQDMMGDPALAENFIQPFKSQGAAEVNDVGIVVRGKFKTKPGAQWAIRKQVYSRVQKAFDENNIDFARKEVRVQIPGLENNDDLDEKQKKANPHAAG
jgi:small-conductance mechanosensitive channel